jgi:hypothetical protein
LSLLEQDGILFTEPKNERLFKVIDQQSGQFTVVDGKLNKSINLSFLTADINFDETSNFHPHVSRDKDVNVLSGRNVHKNAVGVSQLPFGTVECGILCQAGNDLFNHDLCQRVRKLCDIN